MAEDETRPPSTPPATSSLQPEAPRVPNLIDQFQQRHSAWLAQADDLVRLREEVRVAAEHDALEIITAARRDVRRIVIDARRELLALTAQLQAAADATTNPGAAALPQPEAADGSMTMQGALGETRDHVRSARRDVRSVLDEARAEIDALMTEATQPATIASAPDDRVGAAVVAFRSRATAPDAATRRPDGDTAEELDTERPLPTVASLIGPAPRDAAARRVLDPDRIDRTPDDEWLTTAQLPPNRTPDASRMTPRAGAVEIFAASEEAPAVSTTDATVGVFSSIGAPAPPRLGGIRTAVVRSIAAAAVAVALTAAFVLFRPDQRSATPPAAREAHTAAPTSPSGASATGAPAVLAPVLSPEDSVSLTIETRRPAWIQTSIDGQEEAGRTVPAGETRRIVGARSVAIRAGDAGAVYVAVGGGSAEPLGASGAVTTRRFTADDRASAPAANANSGETPDVGPGPAATQTSVSAAATRPAPANAPATGATGAAADAGPAARPSTPSAPSVSAPTSPTAPPVAAAAGIQSGARTDLVQAGQQWLDAYHRRDRAGMAELGAEGVKVADERTVAERFQSSQSGVRRELDQVELELTGDTAVMTARMTERADGLSSSTLVSRVSQVWIRRSGRWQLSDVRLIAESRLNQLVR